jgi:hypothetical protein
MNILTSILIMKGSGSTVTSSNRQQDLRSHRNLRKFSAMYQNKHTNTRTGDLYQETSYCNGYHLAEVSAAFLQFNQGILKNRRNEKRLTSRSHIKDTQMFLEEHQSRHPPWLLVKLYRMLGYSLLSVNTEGKSGGATLS